MFNFNQKHIQAIIYQLKNAAHEAVIVVEGKNDRIALEKLGIGSKIFLLNYNKKSLIDTSEQLIKKFNNIILMLDSDNRANHRFDRPN
jgi:5S rRNA maturation endonuclease (ribonuclease M5)